MLNVGIVFFFPIILCIFVTVYETNHFNMLEIKIISDRDNVYEPNSVISADRLIEDYCEVSNCEDVNEWLHDINIKDAVNFITDAWGIEYEL